jgi:hypothetical protein
MDTHFGESTLMQMGHESEEPGVEHRCLEFQSVPRPLLEQSICPRQSRNIAMPLPTAEKPLRSCRICPVQYQNHPGLFRC